MHVFSFRTLSLGNPWGFRYRHPYPSVQCQCIHKEDEYEYAEKIIQGHKTHNNNPVFGDGYKPFEDALHAAFAIMRMAENQTISLALDAVEVAFAIM